MTNNTKDTIANQNNIDQDDLLRLDNQLCFALYVCSKEIIKKYKPLLEPLGLTYTGYITMLALWEQDEITVKDLGQKLFLDSGTLTPLLKKMESQGYLTRIRSMNDERNVVIKLTEKGRNLKINANDVPWNLICSLRLEKKDIEELLSRLHKFMNHIVETE